MKQFPAYPAYKNTKCDWFPNIPSHWEIDRAKWSVSSCQNGVWGAEPDGDDDLVCIRVADFDRQSLRVSTEKLTMRSITEKDRRNRLLKDGDLLLEKSGGGEQQLVGAVVEFNQPFPAVTSNFIARMVATDAMNSRFLVYLHSHLYSRRVNFRSIKQTTGIQNLDSQAYLDEPITYPPLDEQQIIARFLDFKTAQIDALIEKKKELLNKLAEKRTALISHFITKGLNPAVRMKDSGVPWLGKIPAHWDAKRLKFCLSIQNGRDYKDVQATEGYPVYGSGGRFTFATQYLHDGEAVLLGRKGTIDRPLYVNEAFWTVDTMYYAIPVDGCNGKFAYYCATLIPFNFYSTDTALPSMTQSSLNNHVFAMPPTNEQEEIVIHIDEVNRKIDLQISKITEVIARLTEYRSALITNAVTGKIDVRKSRLQSKTNEISEIDTI